MPFAKLNGATLHFQYRRPGPGGVTLAFSNSLGSDLRVWDLLVDRLPSSWGLLRYDTRGHGLTDVAPAGDVAIHVADLLGVLDYVGADRVVLVGLSAGGLIGQALAAVRPERLAALVIANSAAKVGSAADWNGRIEAVRSGGIAALAQPVMARWFSPAFHAAEPDILAGMTNMLVRQPADGYVGLCEMLRDTDLTAAASGIGVPTLLTAGTLDGSVPPDVVQATAARIPGSTFHLFEGAGHIPCVERPDEFAGVLTAFLIEHRVVHE